MLREETFFVPYMAPSGNRFWTGMHWSKRNKEAKTGHHITLLAARGLIKESLKNIVPFGGMVSLVFQPIHGKGSRRRDCTNYFPTVKVLEDGLCHAKIIKDDSFSVVQEVSIKKPIKGNITGTRVTIKEVK